MQGICSFSHARKTKQCLKLIDSMWNVGLMQIWPIGREPSINLICKPKHTSNDLSRQWSVVHMYTISTVTIKEMQSLPTVDTRFRLFSDPLDSDFVHTRLYCACMRIIRFTLFNWWSTSVVDFVHKHAT